MLKSGKKFWEIFPFFVSAFKKRPLFWLEIKYLMAFFLFKKIVQVSFSITVKTRQKTREINIPGSLYYIFKIKKCL